MEWWNAILNGILEYWNGIATCAELFFFFMCLMSQSVQQLFRRSDQWRKTKHVAALTLLLLLTVTKVVYSQSSPVKIVPGQKFR